MNSYILKSLREEHGNLYRPQLRRPGKRKSTFIDHNDYPGKDAKQSQKYKSSTHMSKSR